jgi:ParB family chromosome partitioning protein
MLIPIDSIVIASGHRRINPAKVKELVVSIQTIGLKTPIAVRPDLETPGRFILVVGRHRIEAYRRLGHAEIEATLESDSQLDADLWETAENLHRAELTAVQQTVAQAEWIKLVAKKIKRDQRAKARQVGANESRREDGRGHRQESGVRAASRTLGIAETSARRAINIADNLTDAARREAERLGLDNNQRALEHACKVGGGDEQVRALHRFLDRKQAQAVARQEAKERKAQREAAPAAAVPATAQPPGPKETPDQAFGRWFWSLDIVLRTEVVIWLLGLDMESFADDLRQAEENMRRDREALH